MNRPYLLRRVAEMMRLKSPEDCERILDGMPGDPDDLSPSEFASSALDSALRIHSGDPISDPLPDRLDFLRDMLDRVGCSMRPIDKARASQIARGLIAEAGPDTVLIRGTKAYVPSGDSHYRVLDFRDLDCERIIAQEVISAEVAPGGFDPIRAATAIRAVPEAIRAPILSALETSELQPRAALGDLAALGELEAGIVCRLAMIGLEAIRGLDRG